MYIERPRIVALAKSLPLDKSVKDAIHGHFCFELLIGSSDSLDNVLAQRILTMAISGSLLNCILVLEGPTSRAVAQVAILIILQEVGLPVVALEALEGNYSALSFAILLQLLLLLLLLSSILLLLQFLFSRQGGQVRQLLFSCLFRGGSQAEGRGRIRALGERIAAKGRILVLLARLGHLWGFLLAALLRLDVCMCSGVLDRDILRLA